MNPFFSIAIFLAFCACSFVTGLSSFRQTERMLVADLDNALASTLAAVPASIEPTDTIKACRMLAQGGGGVVQVNVQDAVLRRNLKTQCLRHKAYTVCSLDGNVGSAEPYLMSDTLFIYGHGRKVAVRGCASFSPLEVLAMSDQRMPLSLLALAFVWLASSVFAFRRGRLAPSAVHEKAVNGMMPPLLDASKSCLNTDDGRRVGLTPMQFRLMEMFFGSADRCLSKAEICSSLWPKKDDASETLYTLVRRLRLVLQQNTDFRIETGRNGQYKLTRNNS